jgi:hypothetical protein
MTSHVDFLEVTSLLGLGEGNPLSKLGTLSAPALSAPALSAPALSALVLSAPASRLTS